MIASTESCRPTVRSGPLEDVRVLALEQYGAGPFATAQLVDLGADVIKIEDPNSGGDVGAFGAPIRERGLKPLLRDVQPGQAERVARPRDVRRPARSSKGSSRVRTSCSRTSAETCRPSWGSDTRISGIVNEKIVCCFLTSYGIASSEQEAPGYDYVMQGRAGWMSLTGEPDGPPAKSGLSLVDYSTGLAAAVAMVAGVHAARRTGHGTDCDLALFDTAIGMLTYVGAWHLSAGYMPSGPRTRHIRR